MKKVAVTGGLACGKSTVCQYFEELGAYVVDADAIVHDLLSSSLTVKQRVVDLFGPSVISGNKIDRKKVASLAFANHKLLRALETLLHPLVICEINALYERACKEKHYDLFVAEIPLLYEAGMESHFDVVIVVQADAEIAQQRSRFSKTAFCERMQRQEPVQSKSQKANFTICNHGSLADLRVQVKQIFYQLQESNYQ